MEKYSFRYYYIYTFLFWSSFNKAYCCILGDSFAILKALKKNDRRTDFSFAEV